MDWDVLVTFAKHPFSENIGYTVWDEEEDNHENSSDRNIGSGRLL